MTGASPLAGRRVVNTRALSQAGELDRVLEAHGAIPLSFPCIAIGPPGDVGALERAIGRLGAGGFDWVVFTSVNTVEAVAGRMNEIGFINPCGPSSWVPARTAVDEVGRYGRPGLNPRAEVERLSEAEEEVNRSTTRSRGSPTGTDDLCHQDTACHPERSEGSRCFGSARVAVVGAVTGEAVTRLLGSPVAFAPGVETAVELGRTLPIASGDRVLLPQSALAGPALAAILSARGSEVTEVVAYETVTGAGGVDLASLLAAGAVDAVCFTSGSTVRGCLDRLGGEGLPGAVRVACIGPETAEAARSLGLRVDVVPVRPTVRALVESLAETFVAGRAQ